MRKISSLKSFYNYFYRREMIKNNPAALVKLPKLHEKEIIRLDVDEVAYIETDGSGRGCRLHTLSGEEYADSSPLSEYESRLNGQGFYRIHKTCLVRLKYIQDIFPWNNSSFALRVRGSSSPLPIGRDRVKELRRRLHI